MYFPNGKQRRSCLKHVYVHGSAKAHCLDLPRSSVKVGAHMKCLPCCVSISQRFTVHFCLERHCWSYEPDLFQVRPSTFVYVRSVVSDNHSPAASIWVRRRHINSSRWAEWTRAHGRMGAWTSQSIDEAHDVIPFGDRLQIVKVVYEATTTVTRLEMRNEDERDKFGTCAQNCLRAHTKLVRGRGWRWQSRTGGVNTTFRLYNTI